MKKVGVIAGQALGTISSQSDSLRYQEGSGYLNDIRLESFGHFLAEYVIAGADITVVDKQISISEGIISLSDQLWRSFASVFSANKESTTYYVGFVAAKGFIFGPSEPSEDYLRLWSVTTNANGVLGLPVDYRGDVGKIKFKAIYDGVYVNKDGIDYNATIYSDKFVATEGQTLFVLTYPYGQFQNRIEIEVGGVPQYSPMNFSETSSLSFTLSEGVPEGTRVVASYFSKAPPLGTDLEAVVDSHTVSIAGIEISLMNIDGGFFTDPPY